MENAVRSYLNSLTLEDGLTLGGAGFDLSDRLPEVEAARVRNDLAVMGFDLVRITMMDFDLPEELVKARGEIQEQNAKKLAAKEKKIFRSINRSHEIQTI